MIRRWKRRHIWSVRIREWESPSRMTRRSAHVGRALVASSNFVTTSSRPLPNQALCRASALVAFSSSKQAGSDWTSQVWGSTVGSMPRGGISTFFDRTRQEQGGHECKIAVESPDLRCRKVEPEAVGRLRKLEEEEEEKDSNEALPATMDTKKSPKVRVGST
mmetsp:Transcript_55733/g.118730  ORF Transcript_55733/g.118730 Transcript_55733/m.118730 type:complete len:162 (-) Transcript_55733:38-523(-)